MSLKTPDVGLPTSSCQTLPSYSTFRDPLLKVLGEMTHLTPDVGVKAGEVIREVLVSTGYDTPPPGCVNWGIKGVRSRVLGQASNMTRLRGRKRRVPPLYRRDGLWFLTQKGVEQARPLVSAPKKAVSRKPNVTAMWFAKHLTPPRGETQAPLMGQMEAALKYHLPVSSRAGLIEDHINTFVAKAIRRDALAKHLQKGKMQYGRVISWAVNSGRSDARNMGTNPVCREMYGARTERERKHGVKIVDDDAKGHCWDSDGSIIGDGTSTDNLGVEAEFEATWDQVKRILQAQMPKAWERYSNVIAMRAQQMSVKEIAQAEGVSRNRAAAMLAEVRKVLRQGVNSGELDSVLSL